RFVWKRQQRARVAHRKHSRRHLRTNFVRQFQEPEMVGDRRTVLPYRRRDVFLRQVKLLGKASIGQRLLDGIEVFTLDVLDERHLEQRPLLTGTDLAYDDRNAKQASFECSPPASFAGDDLESLAGFPDDDRLDDAVGLNGVGKIG